MLTDDRIPVLWLFVVYVPRVMCTFELI